MKKQTKDNCDYKSVLIFDHDKSIGTLNIPPDLWKDIQKILKRDRCEIRDYVYSALIMYTEVFRDKTKHDSITADEVFPERKNTPRTETGQS